MLLLTPRRIWQSVNRCRHNLNFRHPAKIANSYVNMIFSCFFAVPACSRAVFHLPQ